jgi:hypothetical protein
VLSTVGGCASTGLQQSTDLRHQAVRGRRREKKKMMMNVAIIGPVGVPALRRTERVSIGPHGRPQGPLAPRTTITPPTSPHWDHHWHFLLVRQSLRALGCHQISRVRAATSCSIGSPTSPSHPAKVVRPDRGTQRPDLVDERPRKRGSGAEEQERVEKVWRQRRSPRGGVSGGELDRATAGHHHR